MSSTIAAYLPTSSTQKASGTTVSSSRLSAGDRPAWARAQAPWPFRVATPFGPSVPASKIAAAVSASAI